MHESSVTVTDQIRPESLDNLPRLQAARAIKRVVVTSPATMIDEHQNQEPQHFSCRSLYMFDRNIDFFLH